MSESKKGIHQINPNSFLFFNTPEIFYNISFEQIQDSKIKIIIIKILENVTYIYDSIVDFSEFGTGDNSPQDTIKNLDFIIYNYNFIIKETGEKMNILINTKNPKNIELNLHKLELEEDNLDLSYKEQMKNFENKIQELINISNIRAQEISKMKNNEDSNLNKIKYLTQFTDNLMNEIKNKNSNNQFNNSNGNYNKNDNNSNQYNNNKYNYNNNNQNKNNQYNNYNNNQNNINNNNQYNNNFNQYNSGPISYKYENNNTNYLNDPYQKSNYYKSDINNNPYQNQNNNPYLQNNNHNVANNPYNNINEYQNNFKIEKRKKFTGQSNYNDYIFNVYKVNNNPGQNPYN